jgi:signal transduction histidine kinase
MRPLDYTLFLSKGNKGTGLGLFIANKIIAQHGAKITVDSKPNQGSSFRVSIPTKISEKLKSP